MRGPRVPSGSATAHAACPADTSDGPPGEHRLLGEQDAVRGAPASSPAWATRVHAWWAPRRPVLLPATVLLLSAVALVKLADEFRRLLWESSRDGAIDLLVYFHPWVLAWFAGDPAVTRWPAGVYPPASYPLLWPLVGWLSPTAARWWWAAVSLLVLAWLSVLLVRASGARGPWERALAALLLLATNATGVVVGNGQLTLIVLAPLVAGLTLLERANWRRDLLAAALLTVALVKPNLSVPFFWIVLFRPGRLGPILLVSAAYLALTVFAASFQPDDLPTLLRDWLGSASQWSRQQGVASLPVWLETAGLGEWTVVTSAAALVALGAWTWYCRHADLWLLIGVAAMVARLATYHVVYDDVLVVLAMTALLRQAWRAPTGAPAAVTAGLLLAVTLAVMLLPARLVVGPSPWKVWAGFLQAGVWLATLGFLGWQALHEAGAARRAGGPQPAAGIA